ncbi:hypothetical protein GF327_05525 [Candidatus Woesearchaeota archaeon]|nr:hypothetical protein [Candidatus Woesearchaeota archaeon]
MKPNKQQKIFVEFYLKHQMNATKAAKMAGYSSPSYGRELIMKPHIQESIKKQFKEKKEKISLQAEDVIMNLKNIVFADITQYVRLKNGKVKIKDLSKADTSVIQSITQTKHGIKLKLYDKMKALELLGKYFALFTERVEHTGEIELLEKAKQILDRPD